MDNYLSELIALIADGKISELEAERLLNAAARLSSGVPTGISQNPKSYTRTQ